MPTTAGEVLTNYLAQQLAELRHQEPLVRREEPDSVHQMRMCARRLRSVLATGQKLFNDGAVSEVRAELRWLSEVLGSARDPEVIHDRLRELLAKEPDALVFGPAAQRIGNELDATSAAGRRAVLEALDGDRYASLISRLEALMQAPPLTEKAAGDARKTTRKLVSRDTKRVRRRVRELEARPDGGSGEASPAPGGPARDAGLHEVRKAAKRLRYAAEAAEPVAGRKAARMAKRAHKLQQILGLHQDSVVARKLLADLGARAFRSGENGFTYGRLHAQEEALADRSEAKFRKAWKKFPGS
ncbi:CHAD domain-containing protein [Arthrobacter oryzae]|uniref:CHAD domain-containing protein n=1 Tax=Arthrobacter oryzae TaxID=409290 RepID=UPI0027814FEE|nr:CHAD domain-containing protein [Arthrobacter oryzae]MDQ0079167.1 CHAD domain-containing protein [Arthrobacter oryzae]